MLRKIFLLVSVAALAGCASAGPLGSQSDSQQRSTASDSTWSYVSASTVDNGLQGSLDSVRPPVNTPDGVELLLGAGGPTDDYGPLGSYGPLATLGPLGNSTWNVETVFKSLGNWSKLSKYFSFHGGPLSADGPLGSNGPLGPQAYQVEIPGIDDFAKQLQAGGVWTVLGPLGPLGALGPLGPLGPMGAHGFAVNSDGDYTNSGSVMRTVNVPFNGSNRVYELFENYSKSHAQAMTDNDTSFMVEAANGRGADNYSFTSSSDQYVTLIAVPDYQADTFELDLIGSQGGAIAKSNSEVEINWIQYHAQAGEHLTARVKCTPGQSLYPNNYRLIVVGSGPGYDSNITGKHQHAASN